MSVIGSNVLAGASGGAGAADSGISRSLRFNSGDSAYLNRTPSSAGNRKTWTWSGWVKRSAIGTKQIFFGVQGTSDTTYVENYFATDDKLYLRYGYNSVAEVRTTQVFRDTASWMHIVIVFNVTESADADKLKLYINGSQVTDFSTDTRSSFSNQDYGINRDGLHKISGAPNGSGDLLDAYLADVHFIDGQALAPTDFGETDDNGVWQPKEFEGTYGTNGFHLDFADNSSNAALGTDTSGLSNTWTVNNLSVAAGAGNDSLVDTPTNGTQTDTGAGGEVVGNYATLNPLNAHTGSDTFSNGNLDFTTSSGGGLSESTIAMSSGKYYFEVVYSGGQGTGQLAGIRKPGKRNYDDSYIYVGTGNKYINGGSGASYGASLTNGDVIGTAFDADNGTLTFYKNGVSQGTAFTGITGTYAFFVGSFGSSPTYVVNFGQRAFAHTAPSGYKSLNTANLPTPTIADGSQYFDTKLYTGNQSARSISTSFSPDFVWIKDRTQSGHNHNLLDTVRGAPNILQSDTTVAEITDSTDGLTSFNSDGFSLGANALGNQSYELNKTGNSYAAWTWDAGANSDKTYTVTVSGGNFYIDGVQQPTLTLAEGSTYKFDQADSTNATHPLRFSTTSDGTHGGGSEYTTGVTTAGTPGSAGAYTQIVIAASAPTLYAYCTNHSGMGFQVNTSDTEGSTIVAGSLNSSLYDQSQNWTNLISFNAGGWNGNGTNPFDADATNYDYGDTTRANGGYATLDVSSLTGSRVISVTSEQTEVTITHAGGTTTYTPTTTSRLTHTFAAVTNPTSIKFDGLNSSSQFVLVGVTIDGARLINSGISLANVPSIASTVRANPSAGFSIVKFTNTTSNSSVGHGLNAKPELIIWKKTSGTSHWGVYHGSLGATKYLYLNLTNAAATGSEFWNNTEPTNSVVSTKGEPNSFGSAGDTIMYCFAPVAGYSAMGSYTGNGSSSDGVFVSLGFKPSFLLIKNITAGTAEYWILIDSARSPSNVANNFLYPNDSLAEGTQYFDVDLLSNGFKLRNSAAATNASTNTYIYYAVAENPFQANGGLAR